MKWIDDKSFATRQIWVDASSFTSGEGTAENPFTYNQLRNYFNPDLGDYCPFIPTDGDLINIKNTINLINEPVVFSIKCVVDGTVYLCSWDVVNLGVWKIETKDLPESDIILFQNEPGYYISNIQSRDFILCQNNGESSTVKPTNFVLDQYYPMTVDLKNFIISAVGNVDFGQTDNATLNCYGYSIKCKVCDFGTDGLGHLNMYIGTINAASLVDHGGSTTSTTTSTTLPPTTTTGPTTTSQPGEELFILAIQISSFDY